MSYAQSGADALEYNTWRHGASRLVFRGPRMRFDGAFNLALGDAATFGRFIERPWPGQVDAATGMAMANLGAQHAGVEALTLDPEIGGLMGRAQAVVIQITGAHLVSNAYYRLHPRRNDRFIAATPKLVELFPEVDYTDFSFTRHLLATLRATDAGRYARVVTELRASWTDRMRALIAQCAGPCLALWLAEAPPPAASPAPAPVGDPLFVTRAMIDALRPLLADVVEVTGPTVLPAEGMVHAPMQTAAAAALPGPQLHAAAAAALAERLRRLRQSAA
jgi:hypothetical protein